MLEKLSTSVIFYAFPTFNGVAATGLTLTVDVWRVIRDGTATEIVTAGAVTEIGDGVYRYLLAAGSTGTAAEYIAVFKVPSTDDVDVYDLPALWVVDRAGISNLDSSIAGVKAETATINTNTTPLEPMEIL